MSTQQHTDCRECRAGYAQALTLDMGWSCMTHGLQRLSDWLAPSDEASQIVRDSEYVKALVDAAGLAIAEADAGLPSYHDHDDICAFTVLEEALRPFIPAARVEENGRA